ncbi:hypothetical protein PMI40_04640 [Herbaspirillum sp. YR522]|nr:hypothetical protein PMI40_04640 [Herbaspirillum sp. YR522]
MSTLYQLIPLELGKGGEHPAHQIPGCTSHFHHRQIKYHDPDAQLPQHLDRAVNI